MPYRYGIRNIYRPSQLAPNAYGWSRNPGYNRADVPTALMDRPGNVTAEEYLQNFAYEWFQSGQITAGMSNPPFVSGAAGRLLPTLQGMNGESPRILRGYIRRAQYEAKDDLSRTRLYFMYNPEVITRDYVSYLDQAALDPFNTVYQSGNLVAPPSILDFSFDLFFDRQEEAVRPTHPGVYVDYQFFDMVVRNVVPTDPNQVSNTLPDNGVMMVNPRDITVVFSPQFTVQGRPLNARVSFEKFTHRMVPTRMRISLVMRAVYMGPVKDMSEYRAEEFAAELAIPLDEIKNPTYIINQEQLTSAEGAAEGTTSATLTDSQLDNYLGQIQFSGGANAAARTAALSWAVSHVTESTRYSGGNTGSNRYNLPSSADCSGLIASAYIGIGQGTAMNWNDHPGTAVMDSRFKSSGWKTAQQIPLTGDAWNQLRPGDLLYRIGSKGHVKFFVSLDGNKVRAFGANGGGANPQVGYTTSSIASHSDYSYAVRPMPLGQDMSANANNNPTSGTGGGGGAGAR